MITKEIQDEEVRAHLASLPADGREIYLFGDKSVRMYALSLTKSLNSMKESHNLGSLETYVLSQAYIGVALLSSQVKGNDRIRLDIECGGPIKGLSVESGASGYVRGYLVYNTIPVTGCVNGDEGVNMLFGPGFLTVTKTLEGAKTPFSGTVMMQYGNIAKDLALYFSESEQTPTLFYISVKLDEKGYVSGGGGIFLQLMPKCPESVVAKLEEKASKLKGLGKLLSEGVDIRSYVESEFEEFSPLHLSSQPLSFSCPCSKERFRIHLSSLPGSEKNGIMEGKFPLDLECLNCGSVYSFEKKEVEELFGKGGDEK